MNLHPIYLSHTKVYIFDEKKHDSRHINSEHQHPLRGLTMIYPSRAQTITYPLISPLERVLSKRWNGDFPRSGKPSFHRTKRGCPVQEGNYFSTTERTQPRATQKTLAVAKEGAMKYTPTLLTTWLDKIRYLCGSNCRT